MYFVKVGIYTLTFFAMEILIVNGGGKHYCERPATNPCQNGATCKAYSGGNAYYCICMEGYTGYNCELINCTSRVHCGQYGECQSINGGRDKTCLCYYGWTGTSCNQIDVCTPYKKADIVFVIDISLSEGYGTFVKQKQYVKNFISKYQIGPPNYRYQFSLVTYSLLATVHFYFNTYENITDLQNAIDLISVDCEGPSLTGNALKIVRTDIFRAINGARIQGDVDQYVILLTDGLSSDPTAVVEEADLLKAEGVRIYTVGSGTSIRHDALLEISTTNRYVFPIATEDSLQTILKYTMYGCDKCTSKVSDVAILMDVSASIKHQELDIQIRAVIHLLGITKVGPKATQFSYSTFTETVHNVYDFTTYKSRADQIADVSKTTRQTISTTANLANALNELNQNGFSAGKGSRLDARKIVVVVTTGSTNDMQQVLAETKQLKDSGNIIVTVGVGLNAYYTNLLKISSDPTLTFILGDDVHINVNVLDSLKTLLVYDQYCSSSLYCINGGTCSSFNGGSRYTCKCANGWMGSNCEQIDVCTPYKKADIVFVLDTSLSEGDDGFEKQKQYVKRFISKYQYQIGPPNYRYQFSLITYSLHATVHFYFNTFNNETDLQNAMDLLKVNCSGPSLAGNALKIVRGDVFQTSNGARKDPDVERYIMLLSDGLLSDAPDTILEANVLKVNGFKIYTIGSGKSILHENLLEISSFNDYVFHMATEDGIQTLLKHTMFGCKKCSSKVSDVAILMDVSASIKHQELDIQIRAVIHLLGITKVGPKATQFSYSTFTETVHNVYDFTTYKSRADQIADISKKTRQTISTTANLANALNELKQNGFSAGRGSRLDARKIIVVVTTGSTNDMKQVLTETNKLRNSGKIIVTVGAGLNANYTNLLEISSDPALTFILGDDVHINVKVLDSLKTLLENPEHGLCKFTCFIFIKEKDNGIDPCEHGVCSSNNNGHSYNCTCEPGWKAKNCNQIDCSSPLYCLNGGMCVPTNGGTSSECHCTNGWTGNNCQKEDVCTPYKKADIVFVLDTSMSEGDDAFEKQKQYVKKFISRYQYQTGPPNYRYQFSLVTYSLQAKVHFYLNTFSNITDLQNAIDSMKENCSGPSMTKTALKTVRNDVLTTVNGARDKPVEQYVILVTDGLSSYPIHAVEEAVLLKRNGVTIYSVGTGDSIRHEELLDISKFSAYDDHVLVFPMATDDSIQHLLKYTMFECDKCSIGASDVQILMDVSANIKEKDFSTQVQAVIHILANADIGPEFTQLRYSTFTDTANTIYDFDTYNDSRDHIAEVSRKTKQASSTNVDVAKALDVIYLHGFSNSTGARPGARQILILITSGNISDMQKVLMKAKHFKDQGVIVVTIGAGLNSNYTNLLEIASDPFFTFILGDDVNIDVKVLDSLKTTLVYGHCPHV
ncbi:collagen alpha-6(VI) chain-like [Ruditapes philippinarum]|uniref:collagen alpha-6(VI) chain-like n=1 Tax=Ruditapes philippinarum TaxID=129788 RepID=UPI00295B7836|nr:collagen alpha-6(VI) chain-like [Ruditapes philippinarum]